ncbi:MAG: hypothetical protein WCJ72_08150 [Chryseobacterium sp.]
MNCPNCKNPIQDNATSCEWCGFLILNVSFPSQVADTSKFIKAYCLKTGKKNMPLYNAIISKTKNGGYIANGDDGAGNPMAAMLNENTALKAIEDGVAKMHNN